MQRGAGCREAVRRVQAWCLAEGREAPDDNTSAYCQARAWLPLDALRQAHRRLVDWLSGRTSTQLWQGRSVKLIDGCGYSMPDIAANHAVYPYDGCQQPGCGFPTAKLVGLFCLATGALVRFAHGSWKTHEVPPARQLVAWMQPGDVVLADRGFCGRGLIALLQRKGVDVVMRPHQARAEGLGGHLASMGPDPRQRLPPARRKTLRRTPARTRLRPPPRPPQSLRTSRRQTPPPELPAGGTR